MQEERRISAIQKRNLCVRRDKLLRIEIYKYERIEKSVREKRGICARVERN